MWSSLYYMNLLKPTRSFKYNIRKIMIDLNDFFLPPTSGNPVQKANYVEKVIKKSQSTVSGLNFYFEEKTF